MIHPISANQAFTGKVAATSPVSFGRLHEDTQNEEQTPVGTALASNTSNKAFASEKLNTTFTGCREYSLNGNKVDYFA